MTAPPMTQQIASSICISATEQYRLKCIEELEQLDEQMKELSQRRFAMLSDLEKIDASLHFLRDPKAQEQAEIHQLAEAADGAGKKRLAGKRKKPEPEPAEAAQ